MAKPDLGTKRTCTNCGAKFYDLRKNPVVCPKCDTVFTGAPAARPAPAAKAAAPQAREEPPAPAAEEAAEVVSLEDAEKEQTASPRKEPATGGDFEIEGEEETLAGDDEDEPFLADDEDENDDVTGIIGGGIDANDED